jgi:hypothetical protein
MAEIDRQIRAQTRAQTIIGSRGVSADALCRHIMFAASSGAESLARREWLSYDVLLRMALNVQFQNSIFVGIFQTGITGNLLRDSDFFQC